MKVVKKDKFRSGTALLNADYDMIRVTLDMTLNEWYILRSILNKRGKQNETDQ